MATNRACIWLLLLAASAGATKAASDVPPDSSETQVAPGASDPLHHFYSNTGMSTVTGDPKLLRLYCRWPPTRSSAFYMSFVNFFLRGRGRFPSVLRRHMQPCHHSCQGYPYYRLNCAAAPAPRGDFFRCVNYVPVLDQPDPYGSDYYNQDFTKYWGAGSGNRNDLGVIKSWGATHLRMYNFKRCFNANPNVTGGCSPPSYLLEHTGFMQQAGSLQVIVPIGNEAVLEDYWRYTVAEVKDQPNVAAWGLTNEFVEGGHGSVSQIVDAAATLVDLDKSPRRIIVSMAYDADNCATGDDASCTSSPDFARAANVMTQLKLRLSAADYNRIAIGLNVYPGGPRDGFGYGSDAASARAIAQKYVAAFQVIVKAWFKTFPAVPLLVSEYGKQGFVKADGTEDFNAALTQGFSIYGIVSALNGLSITYNGQAGSGLLLGGCLYVFQDSPGQRNSYFGVRKSMSAIDPWKGYILNGAPKVYVASDCWAAASQGNPKPGCT